MCLEIRRKSSQLGETTRSYLTHRDLPDTQKRLFHQSATIDLTNLFLLSETPMRHIVQLASVLTLVLTGSAALSQDVEGEDRYRLETGLSTLGLFVAPDFAVSQQFRVRTPIYFGSLSDTFDADGNDVDGSLDFTSGAVIADYYVGEAGFRVSGGLSFGGYDLTGNITDPTLDGRTYSGDFTVNMQQTNEIAPVVAVGYRRDLGNNWGVAAELGARVSSLSVSTTGQENLSATDRADFDADIADVNSDLDDFGLVPFISIGVSFRF